MDGHSDADKSTKFIQKIHLVHQDVQEQLENIQAKYKAMLIFVAWEGVITRGQGARHVVIFIGTIFYFHFSEIGLEMKIGPHGKVDGISRFVWGCHTHKHE
jgi:hypothetical protein